MPKIKRCKYCGARNVELSHFSKKHHDRLMAARRHKTEARSSDRGGSPPVHMGHKGEIHLTAGERNRLIAMLLTLLSMLKAESRSRRKTKRRSSKATA